MSDVVLAGLFSASGAAAVAIAGMFATIFGPASAARAERREEQRLADESIRFERAEAFFESLARAAVRNTAPSADRRAAHVARMRFVATLRPGENSAHAFTAGLLRKIENDVQFGVDGDDPFLPLYIDEGADRLFRWLREDQRGSLKPFTLSGSAANPSASDAEYFF